MTDEQLEAHVRDYYQGQQLSPEALARLKETIASEKAVSGRWMSRRNWLGMTAAILVAIIGVALLLVLSSGERLLRAAIAEEAARDHNLRLSVEIETPDYAVLRSRMASLGFSPVEPAEFRTMNMRLIGARYGTLQGQPAVQLKLADSQGEVCTLTETRPAQRLNRISHRSRHQRDGLVIDVWREKGLVMVLTRPVA